MNQQLQLAIGQIRFAREYTLSLVDDLPRDEWFRQPAEGVTHIAWQIGHLAMAQYGLTLFRIRGRGENDSQLMSGKFRKLFSRGSTPQPASDDYPDAAEIRAVFDRVYGQAMEELPTFSEEQLNQSIAMPFAVHATNLGGLLFCAQHEMLHAGQIGLLRRLLGHEPVR